MTLWANTNHRPCLYSGLLPDWSFHWSFLSGPSRGGRGIGESPDYLSREKRWGGVSYLPTWPRRRSSRSHTWPGEGGAEVGEWGIIYTPGQAESMYIWLHPNEKVSTTWEEKIVWLTNSINSSILKATLFRFIILLIHETDFRHGRWKTIFLRAWCIFNITSRPLSTENRFMSSRIQPVITSIIVAANLPNPSNHIRGFSEKKPLIIAELIVH